jgi:lysyl-tRNA synthetase class 2
MSTGSQDILIQNRENKLREIAELGFDPYPHKFDYSHTVSRIVKEYSERDAAALESDAPSVRTCGRIMAIRTFGKAAFAHISDGTSRVQFYLKKNEVDEKTFSLFHLLDVGDIVGVEGTLFRTRTNELTILAKDLTFLAKCLLPMPEKWHGLTDVEIRYRQRYLDLIVNPDVNIIFRRRSRIIRKMREFLEERRYVEVETPMMHPLVGGATARPFITHHNKLDMPLYLRIAPELYLKRLTVGGMDRVYEINRNFRNEGISTQHNPEFTMMEFYQAYSDYRDLMDLTREMITWIVDEVVGQRQLTFKGQEIDFDKWHTFSLREAILHFWDRGEPAPRMEDMATREGVAALLQRAGAEPAAGGSRGALLGQLFEEVVEEKLVQPTFIHDYPIELSPLSKQRDDDPEFVERFELFIAGMEIANAYSELNDPEEQRRRFLEQVRLREKGDDEAQMMDEDYIRALRYGMPPAAGEGIGIDRLTMILTDSPSIRDVILFPLLKPEKE